MPFPFMPVGAIVAGAILGAALTLFVWVLMALDRAASRAADSVVSGLVSGFRGWSSATSSGSDATRTTPASPNDDQVSVEPAPPVAVARVHSTLR
jgi:hypothetical protein